MRDQLASANIRLQGSDESSYLQQKPWAFRHELQCHQGGDTGQSTDKYKDSPAVEVVLGSHTEPPAWKQQEPYNKNTDQEFFFPLLKWLWTWQLCKDTGTCWKFAVLSTDSSSRLQSKWDHVHYRKWSILAQALPFKKPPFISEVRNSLVISTAPCSCRQVRLGKGRGIRAIIYCCWVRLQNVYKG